MTFIVYFFSFIIFLFTNFLHLINFCELDNFQLILGLYLFSCIFVLSSYSLQNFFTIHTQNISFTFCFTKLNTYHGTYKTRVYFTISKYLKRIKNSVKTEKYKSTITFCQNACH